MQRMSCVASLPIAQLVLTPFFFLAGVVAYVPIEEPEKEWHKDLTVVSRVAEPPRLLAASRPSQV